METSTTGRAVEGEADADETTTSRAELRTQLELLTEENERLRASYAQAKQSQYRRSALGLAIVGSLAAIGAMLVPTARTVLFALAGTGLFGGVLTYYLTPEQFIAADVGREVYTAVADNEAALTAELGLTDQRIYTPVGPGSEPVRLFIPQDDGAKLPDTDLLASQTILATAAGNGLALTPSGARLLSSLEEALRGSLADTPSDLAVQLCDALSEQFELVDTAEADLDPGRNRCSIAVSGSAYGSLGQFDHPVVSLLAAGFAAGLDVPVRTQVTADAHNGEKEVVTLRWETR